MMNKSLLTTAQLALTAILSITGIGCEKERLLDCTKSTGITASVTRPISGFKELQISDNVDVIIHKGTDYQVRVTAGLNLLDGIITELQGNRLYIRNENRCNWVRSFRNKYTVDITLPIELESIYYDGAGSITCTDTLKHDGFTFDCWNGSGDIGLLLACNTSYLNIHIGRCRLSAKGKTGVTYVYLNDSGTVEASALSSAYVFLRSSSTGSAQVLVTKELGVEIDHTGDVYYSGTPYKISSVVTGKGRLIRR